MMKSINTTFKIIVINKKHPTMKPILYTILICTLVLASTVTGGSGRNPVTMPGKTESEWKKCAPLPGTPGGSLKYQAGLFPNR